MEEGGREGRGGSKGKEGKKEGIGRVRREGGRRKCMTEKGDSMEGKIGYERKRKWRRKIRGGGEGGGITLGWDKPPSLSACSRCATRN